MWGGRNVWIDHNQITLSKGSLEDLGGQGEEGGRKRRGDRGRRERSSEFCTLFYFDLVELNLDFVETFGFE